MKQERTIKLKIGQSDDLDLLCTKFLSACNWLSDIVFSTKETNSIKLHRKHYATIRKRFGLPSQLTCSSFRHVTAAFLSQTKLAKSTGLSTKYVTLIESGRRLPSLECLFALMAEAGVFRDTALELAGKILDQFNWKG